MIISEALIEFYKKNNLPNNGGIDDKKFDLKFKLFTIKLPNSQFRKDLIHIHDIQHLLYDCDITWKGEAFIAGWEISTGLWKKLPIGIMSLWAMGFSLLTHPKDVIRGYREGLKVNGIIDMDIEKKKLFQLSISQLKQLIIKKNPSKFSLIRYIIFCVLSISIVITPILLPLFLLVMYIV